MRACLILTLVLLAACGSTPARPLAMDPVSEMEACERPPHADPVLRGDAAARCGRSSEALRAYEEAWRAGDRRCPLIRAIATLRERGGDVDGARAALGEARCREARLELARLELAHAPASAAETIGALLLRDSDDAEALALLVALHVSRGELDPAEGVCARASGVAHAALDHACARAALAAGRLHAAEGRLREAAAAGSLDAHLELGELLIRERRANEATEAFRGALALDAEGYEATLGLARALRLAGCLREAEAAFDRAVALAPERPEAFWYRATYALSFDLLSESEAMAAIAALTRFVELAGDEPRFRGEVEQVNRRCRRDEPLRRRGYRIRRGCESGLIQQIIESQMGPSRGLLQMQRTIEAQQRARESAARCQPPSTRGADRVPDRAVDVIDGSAPRPAAPAP